MKKRRLYNTLIKNYVVFTSLVIIIFIFAALFTVRQMAQSMNKEEFPKIIADYIVKADYRAIDSSDIELVDGWIEILDESNTVIYTKGNKKTSYNSYSSQQLANVLSYHDTQEYIYTAAPFTGTDGKAYICLVALPHNKVDIQYNLISGPFQLVKVFFINLLKGAGIFLALYILNIYFYSKWTAKKISTPLGKITTVIKEMREGNSKIRMDFKAENEFLEIKDAFNSMADKLQKSEEEKVKLEEARKRMFVDISHDLKTPITTISGYAKALSEGMITEEDKKQRYLQTIYDKSMRVASLINNLFDLAKLENTAPTFQKSKEDFVEFLRGICAEYYEQIEEREMLLDFIVNVDKLVINFDRKEIGRVLSNIINNAILYNPQGTRIRIELFQDEGDVVVEIADNGVGIPEYLKDSVFLPFFRGDSTRNSKGGTGLGLAISKKIIESHGGKLELITNSGEDKTIFRTTLYKTDI